MENLFLGIDTSNYKTSIALVNEEGRLLRNFSRLLDVEAGKRGLRQSDALFHHVDVLPEAIDQVLNQVGDLSGEIKAVSVSTRPRPIEGSYMPVFKAGYLTGKTISKALNVPLYEFSHQEGHIMAGKFYSSLNESREFITFHLSGGTSEVLSVGIDDDFNMDIELLGGSLDISFGQLLDRLGVCLGMQFPSGKEMDEIAYRNYKVLLQRLKQIPLPKIKTYDLKLNLSGIETAAIRIGKQLMTDAVASEGEKAEIKEAAVSKDLMLKENLISAIFLRISQVLEELIEICGKRGQKDFLLVGGVASSNFVRKYLEDKLADKYNLVFPEASLCSDNAIGIALLGKEVHEQKARNCNSTE